MNQYMMTAPATTNVATGFATVSASSDERIVFDSSTHRDEFEIRMKYQGISCQFNYLTSDHRGRDLYQVIRTKL